MGDCKGIYAGCCIIANARCAPCDRIKRGKSTVEKEMARKDRLERKPLKRTALKSADRGGEQK